MIKTTINGLKKNDIIICTSNSSYNMIPFKVTLVVDDNIIIITSLLNNHTVGVNSNSFRKATTEEIKRLKYATN